MRQAQQPACRLRSTDRSSADAAAAKGFAAAAGGAQQQQLGLMQSGFGKQAHVLVAAGLEVAEEVLGQEDDEFYMPVRQHTMSHVPGVAW